MNKNCNWVEHEGGCDGMLWQQCTYCGAVDGIKDPEICNGSKHPKRYIYEEETMEKLDEALRCICVRSLHPQELQAILIHILDELDKLK